MSFAPLYTVSEIRALETAAQAGSPAPSLMERAGEAAAEQVRRVIGASGRSVMVVAGPGNNGGDAFEAAVHLRRWFYRVEVCFLGNASKLPPDAARAHGKWQSAGGATVSALPQDAALRRSDLIVDGLFGIGLARPPRDAHAACIERINASGVRALALDVPSGLDADTGLAQQPAVRAAHTVTFIAGKPGLYTLDGPDCCGELRVETLGLEAGSLQAPRGHLLSAQAVTQALAPRPRNFHKGQAGDVVVLGGAPGMVGAVLLASRAALKCGAGRVYAGLLASSPRVDEAQPELMVRAAADLPFDDAVIAAGPGLGRSEAAKRMLERALQSACALVLDADALNLLAGDAALAEAVRAHVKPVLMTPHPAEAARLLATGTREVQADRVGSALRLAERYRACVALKGNGTVVASPEGGWWINPTGHPGMASAGMGDALTGIVASLVAQGAEPLHALLAGVWLHGAAGDAAAAEGGLLGTTASEVIDQARRVLNGLVNPRRPPPAPGGGA